MRTLLQITAAVSIAWAALLALAPERLAGGAVPPLALTLGHTLAVAHLALAAVFLRTARAPAANLFTVGTAIAFVGARVVVDLWSLLGELPPDPALIFLVDLIVAFALLVGLLEALPRTVATIRAPQPPR